MAISNEFRSSVMRAQAEMNGAYRFIKSEINRTGVKEKTKAEIQEESYTIDRIKAGFNGQHLELVTVVNRRRGFDEYKEVLRQSRKNPKLDRYSQSLFSSMFKNW